MEKFPTFQLAGDPFGTNKDITFKQLATQLSGLPRSTPCFGNDNCSASAPVWDIVRKKVLPIWAPNTLPSYSNLAFSVLGRSLAALGNTQYETWIEQNILVPLNMSRSGFLISDSVAHAMPTILGPNNQPWPKFTYLGWDNPAGQLFSCTNDMAKLMIKFFFENDNIINHRTINDALSPYFNDFNADGGFGMPFEMFYYENLGLWVMTKGGSLPGFYSESAFVKELKVGFAFTTALPLGAIFDLGGILENVVTILGNAVKSAIQKAQELESYPPPDDGFIQKYLACYGGAQPLKVSQPQKNGEWMVSAANQVIPLHYRGKRDDGYIFQIGMTSIYSCEIGEVSATQGQYVIFQMLDIGPVINFELLAGAGMYEVQVPCPP